MLYSSSSDVWLHSGISPKGTDTFSLAGNRELSYKIRAALQKYGHYYFYLIRNSPGKDYSLIEPI